MTEVFIPDSTGLSVKGYHHLSEYTMYQPQRQNAEASEKVVMSCVGIIFSHGKLKHNKPHSLEREIKSSEDGVRLPTWSAG